MKIVRVALILGLLVGCVSETGPLDPSGRGDADANRDADPIDEDEDATVDANIDANVDANIDTGMPDTGCGPGIIIVDFPCATSFRCVSESEYILRQSVSCEAIYAPCPCQGATCEEIGGVRACPSGMLCNSTPILYDMNTCVTELRDSGVLDAQ